MRCTRHRAAWLPLLLLSLLSATAVFGQLPLGAEPGDETSTEAEVDALIRILEDDEARGRLIERLRAADADAAEAEAGLFTNGTTFAGRLAQYTRGVAVAAAGAVQELTAIGTQVGGVLSGAADVDMQALRRVVLGVALVVATVFGTYLVLQLLHRSAERALARRADGARLWRRLRFILASAALDVATVVIAWATGYVVALSAGQSGAIGIDQTLFLNAFLFIELTKAAVRTVLAPRWPALRIVASDDTTAAYWYFWSSRMISLLGYTFMFVAPLLASGVSRSVAEAVRIVVLFTAIAIAIAIVLQNRDGVRERLLRRAAGARSEAFGRPMATLARTWHALVIAYLIGVFTLWLADPETALPFVLTATGQTIAAVVVGVLLVAFISRIASGGMHLPADLKQRLPLLESRLNAFVPSVLRVVRVLVTIGVAVTVAQAWNLANVGAWIASETGQRIVASLVSSAAILIVAGLAYLAVQSWVEYRLNPDLAATVTSRERTLLALFRNAFTIVLVVLVAMLVLSELGVNIGPLLAGAGVVGLAVGFGGQKLVQDVINGAFIQFENTMNEGDIVTAGGITGVVERLTVRSVSLRSLEGNYHVIPFSAVDTVTNFTKLFSFHVAAIGVAYRENVAEVKQAMAEAFERLQQTPFGADIIGPFDMQGLVEFADSAVVVRARIKTLPGKQWALGRQYNEILKSVFDERGIEIPFPHMTVYFGEDKQGNAPPLRLESASSAPQAG